MRKLQNSERFLHCISQRQNACSANFIVLNSRSDFGSVRSNLHSLHISGMNTTTTYIHIYVCVYQNIFKVFLFELAVK